MVNIKIIYSLAMSSSISSLTLSIIVSLMQYLAEEIKLIFPRHPADIRLFVDIRRKKCVYFSLFFFVKDYNLMADAHIPGFRGATGGCATHLTHP